MRVGREVIGVVERAYDVDSPTSAWLEAIREAGVRAFGGETSTITAHTFSMSPAGAVRVHEVAGSAQWERSIRRCHELARLPAFRGLYLGGPVQNLDRVLAVYPEDLGYQQYLRDSGHALLTIGIDPGGSGCAMAIIRSQAFVPSRSTRHALERIAAHLAGARRLRRSLEARRPAEDPLERADAVLGANGSVLHAERDARDADARSSLRDAAHRIDRARMRDRCSSPEEALALWRGLVDGRWSLVERFEADGKRLWVAHRNDPPSRKHRSLSEQERKVAALLAVGHSLKLCAYELGKAESTTSEVARRAMCKLGVNTRAELVELYGALVSGG
jgi:DNA-binding CsgD family transcriptional regulator